MNLRTGLPRIFMWALYAAPTMAVVVWASQTQPLRTVAAIVMTFFLQALLAAAVTRTWRPFFLIQFPICLVCVAFAAYTLVFSIPPGTALAAILVGTSWEEIRGLVDLPQGYQLAALLVAWSVGYLTFIWLAPTGRIFADRPKRWAHLVFVLLVPITAFAASNPAQLMDGIALEPAVGSLKFFISDISQARAALRSSSTVKIAYGAQKLARKEIHILVIGESARRDSWSVYGYSRQTTPNLDALKNEIIFLQNAVADANFTCFAVPMMLTGMTPENFNPGAVRGNIFDLAREAGYRTVFLENQDLSAAQAAGVDPDLIETPLDLLDRQEPRDGDLLPAFRRFLAHQDGGSLIGIHMLGTHWRYTNRYPADFQHFGSGQKTSALSSSPAGLVDSYDNAVLYTDWFLRQIIERARELTVPVTVTYFADHGEDLQLLDVHVGHGHPLYTQHAFEIPAFLWANTAYRNTHPEIIAALEKNAAKEIRSHNVFYTVADLMGIEWPGAMGERSFASDKYSPEPAMKHIAGGVPVSRPQISSESMALGAGTKLH
jgi:glucan phosphoethanolaminetransferase (alkaline phosphatase superfamily)